MKSAPFEYVRAESAAHACELLAQDENARIIAGGQTLVPMLAMRLARPSKLVDIGRVKELGYIREMQGAVTIGATTRQVTVERSALVHDKVPLLGKAIQWVGHPPTRARGTLGGSLANADPAAEISLVTVTLGATLHYREESHEDHIAAEEFFIGPMITILPAGACLMAASFPVWQEARVGTGFHEINARSSDFAFVSAAAQVALDADGKCTRLALGIGGLGDFPFRLSETCKRLEGNVLSDAAVRDAITEAINEVEPFADLHASAEYRQRVAITLACRSVETALHDAKGTSCRAH